jgi:hypothetical protein
MPDYYIQSRTGRLNATYKGSIYANPTTMLQAIRNVGGYMTQLHEKLVWVPFEEILYIQDVTDSTRGETK